MTNTDTLDIGIMSNGSFYFPGTIDDVRIYNRALSASEVKQLYNLGRYTIKSDRPLAHARVHQ